MVSSANFRIGVDLGGTKIECLILDAAGRELTRQRASTPRGSYTAIVDAVGELVEKCEQQLGATLSPGTPVGVGIPGTISPASGLVKNANTTELIGHPLDRDLAQRLDRPVRVANDANCFALSEALDGALGSAGLEPRRATAFGVILGTGVGAGIVVRGQLWAGRNEIAGEWGHNPLPWPDPSEYPGPSCWCGKHGCVETWLCGPALARDHAKHRGEPSSSDAGSPSPGRIAQLAAAGGSEAQATLERYCHRLARALASVLNVLDPDVVILGGGVSNIDILYERVPLLWQQYAFSDQVTTKLVKAQHGDSSGVRGAAWLWHD